MTTKPRACRPFASVVASGSSIVLLTLMLPACGADTEGVFTSPGGNTGGSDTTSSSSSSGQGGTTSSSSGQGGATSSSSGQGGSGGQTSSSSSSGGPVDPEDCLDGLDNDKDGDIDCADSDCTVGFTCTDEPPQGWTSVALERGMGAPPVATPCDGGATPEELFTGPAGPPECSACSCGPLMGTTCKAPPLACFPGSDQCDNNAQDWTNVFGNGNCAKPDIGGVTFALSCRLTGPASVGEPGKCEPSMSDFPNKDTWAGWANACAVKTSAGGCAAGTVCAPKPGASQSLCVRHDGQHACPAGWTNVDAYSGATDDRTCADCSCAASATCMGGTYQVFDGNNCSGGGSPPVTIDNMMCRDVSDLIDFNSWSVRRNPPVVGGNCAAQGGEPKGSVQPTGAVTFCCK